MKFWEAMKHLEEGKKVRCVKWGKNGNIHIKLPIGRPIELLDESGCSTQLLISSSHHLFEEWELYEEPVKTYSFQEIIPFLKEGKKVKRKNWGISWSLHRTINSDWIIRKDIIEDFNLPNICLQNLEATDWVVVDD